MPSGEGRAARRRMETYVTYGSVRQLICKRRSNHGIPSKNKLGNCNTVKNWEIVILPILALNSQKKVFDYVSKSYFFYDGVSRFGRRLSEWVSCYLTSEWVSEITDPYVTYGWREASEVLSFMLPVIKRLPISAHARLNDWLAAAAAAAESIR